MKRSDERKQFLSDIIITAIEGGINYWAVTEKYQWQGREDDVIAVIREYKDETDPKNSLGEPLEINNDVIARGIRKIKDGESQISPNRRKIIAGADVTNDAGDIDAELADCIVQAAVLGDIVYG